MQIYISGPISGKLDYKNDFIRAEKTLTELGHSCINPATDTENELYVQTIKDEKKLWQKCMVNDIKKMLSCDAVVLLDGWQGSRGCALEHVVAKELGLYVFYSLSDVEK